MNTQRNRAVNALVLCCAACAAGFVLAQGVGLPEGAGVRRGDAATDAVIRANRIREGTTITDAMGYFVEDSAGAKFVTQEGHEFGGLQNLNLERVVRLLKSTDDSQGLLWSVSGVVTEFSGRNYLLISRAVYKSNALPPIPPTVVTEADR